MLLKLFCNLTILCPANSLFPFDPTGSLNSEWITTTTTTTIIFICVSPVLHLSILFYMCLNYFLDNIIFFLVLFHTHVDLYYCRNAEGLKQLLGF